jgi:hypothetical protein
MNFYRELDGITERYKQTANTALKSRKRDFSMSDSEIITAMVLFHLKHYRDMKFFYLICEFTVNEI